jgi:bacillithiol system protein YtxJ
MYRELSAEAQAEDAIASPRPTWLFKHSNSCGISASALDEFSAYLTAHPDQPASMVVVQEQRPLSNWIAARLRRAHQSPQLFLLKGGEVLWSASHWSITAQAMDDAWKKA